MTPVPLLCVYALVSPSDATPGTTGLRDERLRSMKFRGVVAIVGVMRSRPRPTVTALRRYDAIIRTLASRFPAVLPSRFGTCVADAEELALIVTSRRAAFVRALHLVRNQYR